MAELHIDLLDGYWIGADAYNYILKFDYISEVVKRNGKMVGGQKVTKDVGYYKTPWDAIRKFFKIYERDHGEPYDGPLVGYDNYIEYKHNEALQRLSVVWNASQAKKEVEHGKQAND